MMWTRCSAGSWTGSRAADPAPGGTASPTRRGSGGIQDTAGSVISPATTVFNVRRKITTRAPPPPPPAAPGTRQGPSSPPSLCCRCLEPNHWEDSCWVASSQELCAVCSVPGHLPVVHTTKDFQQRKLVIDTFGWLSFKDWFQDLHFRRWWNSSGFSGVPLSKVMMRNNSHDLSLK